MYSNYKFTIGNLYGLKRGKTKKIKIGYNVKFYSNIVYFIVNALIIDVIS